MASLSIPDLCKSFERSLRAAGRSPATIRNYRYSVDSFLGWLAAHGQGEGTELLTRDNIRGWLADMADSGRASASRATRFRGLFRYCAWLADEDEIDVNPMAGMQQPKIDQKPVPVVPDDTIGALLGICRSKSFADRRDQAWLRVLVDTGMRVGELVGMTLDGLDLDRGQGMITGKTGSRLVYFSDRTIQALDRYLRARASHRWASLPDLWLASRGRFTEEGVRQRLTKLCERADVPKIHPHQLRHSWAADWLANGGQERDAMRLAGWKSERMLGRYGSATADMRAKAAVQRLRRGDRF